MPIEGVDYSTARPSPSGLYTAGKRFAVRYGGAGSTDKQLQPVEALALTRAGLAIVANVEGTKGGMLGGRTVGETWARNADVHFRRCGMPAGRPIYLSCDIDVTAVQWPAVAEALRGAASVIGAGRVGLYGGRRAIEWAIRDRVAAWFWQTYAWSGGVWVPGIHVRQYRNGVPVAGGDCDLNLAMTVDYGQWTVGSAAVVEEEDMTPDQAATLARVDHRVTTLMYNTPTNQWGEGGEENAVYKVLKLIAEHVDVDPAELAAIEAAAQAGAQAGFAAAADDFVARILAGIQQGADLTPTQMEQVEQAVRDAFAGGLAPEQAPPV